MLRAYIVDDEPLARDEIKYLLNRSKQVEVIGESDCTEDALIDIPLMKPDLIFLDIELSEGNGLKIAKQLERLQPKPAIIFATAYDEYALEAFQLNAVDYLLKPFNEKRMMQTINKINNMRDIGKEKEQQKSVESAGKLAIEADDRIYIIQTRDIKYLESLEGKCIIYTKNNEYKVTEPLVVLEKKLPLSTFIRVHRSFIVNIDEVSQIEPWVNSTFNLILTDGSRVPVSRTYVKELKTTIGF